MKAALYRLTAIIAMLGFSPVVAAETAPPETIPNHPLLRDDFFVSVGGYFAHANTTALLAPSGGGSGLGVNFEDTLDLSKRSSTPIAEFSWRFAERWRLGLEYFKVDRDATRTLAEQVQWGDQVFPIGTTVDSSFGFADTRVSVGYTFFKRRDKELGIGFGLHVAKLDSSISAVGVGAEASDVLAPLPVANLYGTFALTDEWAVRMRADWLSLTYGDYSGDVRGIGIDAVYQPFRNVGFGLGMRSLVMDISLNNSDWHGQARLSFQGPTASVLVSF